MDNITHSLLGIAAAEPLALRMDRKYRVPLWVASAVANNLPDLDVLFTRGNDRLTYMLHHRGYTHTLLLAPVQGMLWLAIFRIWHRKNADIPWKAVGLLCLLGPFLHIFADFWNSYGIHPFWPLDNRWYYGDLIFIVEPWIWALLLPPIWKRAESLIGRSLSLFLLTSMLALAWYHPLVTWPVALALTLFSLAWTTSQQLISSDTRRLSFAAVGILILFASFGWAELDLKHAFATEGTEIAALPQPGNPFCWTMLAAGFQGDNYKASAWTASPWPSLIPATSCQAFSHSSLAPSTAAPSADRVPLGSFRGTRAEYNSIVQNCRGRAYLRVARIPVWHFDGKQFQIGDLRFDRSLHFSELNFEGGKENCPKFEPPWIGRFYPE